MFLAFAFYITPFSGEFTLRLLSEKVCSGRNVPQYWPPFPAYAPPCVLRVGWEGREINSHVPVLPLGKRGQINLCLFNIKANGTICVGSLVFSPFRGGVRLLLDSVRAPGQWLNNACLRALGTVARGQAKTESTKKSMCFLSHTVYIIHTAPAPFPVRVF